MKKLCYLFAICLSCTSCGHGSNSSASDDGNIVAQYRDTLLLRNDVLRQIPPGISHSDSANLIRSIVDNWIDGFLIEDLAASQIDDIERINQLTENYRRSLIADSYRRKMRSLGVQPVDAEGVKRYFNLHRNELILERPVIKGLFIKVPAASRYIDDIRNWMKDGNPDALDQLENISLKETVNFRLFVDKWIDLDAITGEIPFRFGDADVFVDNYSDFETSHNGLVYILHITDFRHSGQEMPEEYATPIIEDRIKNSNLADYENGLIIALRQTAIEKNILKIGNCLK